MVPRVAGSSPVSHPSFSMCEPETIVALSTPLGHSGVALIRVSGPKCGELIRRIFLREKWPARHAILSDYRGLDGASLDHVLFLFFSSPHSYTGEDIIEISCHGNPLIIQRILDDLCQRGCRPAMAGEFTRRAFLNGKMDLSQAEAVNDLIHAQNAVALRLAKNSLAGEIGRRLEPIFTRLLELSARISAQIDFPEEDLDAVNWSDLLMQLAAIRERLAQLRQAEGVRSIITDGIGVVLAGPPNAGKSSILNGLLGRDRAIVSPTAGTTRDFIEETFFLESMPIRLCDTAGLRESDQHLEISGMERTQEKIKAAQIVLWVLDRSQREVDENSLAIDESRINALILNKTDLPARIEIPSRLSSLPACEICAQSAGGIDRLKGFLLEIIRHYAVFPNDCDLIFNLRQSDLLKRAEEILASTARKIGGNFPMELLAEDLNDALESLAQITGKNVTEALLDSIFSSFCIGK